MQKVISINLNGHAYQLEESGYEALRDYLAGAATRLFRIREGAMIAGVCTGLAAYFAVDVTLLFLTAAVLLVAIVNHQEVLGFEVDPDVPVWAAALVLPIAYQIVAAPFRAASAAPWAHAGWPGLAGAAIWLVGLAFAFWVASNHMPEVREFMTRVPELARDFFEDVREWFDARRRA